MTKIASLWQTKKFDYFKSFFFFFLLKVLQPAPHQVITNLPEGGRLPTTRPTRPPPPLIPSSKTTMASEKPSFIMGGSISQVKCFFFMANFLMNIALVKLFPPPYTNL